MESNDVKVESAFTIKRWVWFPLIIIVAIALAWLLLNGKSVMPEEYYSLDMMVLYVGLFLLIGWTWMGWVIDDLGTRLPLLKELFRTSLVRSVPSMIIAALLSILVFFLLFEVLLGMEVKNFSWELVIGFVFLFGFVVAPVEEIVFRYEMPCMTHPYFAQVMFAGFHAVVNDWNLNLFAFNFLFGIIMWELYMNKPPQLRGKVLGIEKPKTKKWVATLFYFGLGPLIVIHAIFNIMFAFYGGIT